MPRRLRPLCPPHWTGWGVGRISTAHIAATQAPKASRNSNSDNSNNLKLNSSLLRRCLSTAPQTPPPASAVDLALRKATELLSDQAVLTSFIHHNPLHRLQHLSFSDALAEATRREQYVSPAERAFMLVSVDPRKRTNMALADLCGPFLDRGGAKWTPPSRGLGFLRFFANHEGLGYASWRQHARQSASTIRAALERDPRFYSLPPRQTQHLHSLNIF